MKDDYVSVDYAKSILRVISDQGYDIDTIIRESGCAFNPIDPEYDSETQMSALQYCQLLRHYVLLAKGSFLGLPILDDDAVGGFRIMCFSIIHSDNLEAAIHRAAKFYQLCSGANWQFRLEVKGSCATIRFKNSAANGKTSVNAYELSAWYRFWAWLTGRHFPLTRVNLKDNKPIGPVPYERLFDSHVYFDQPETSLVFDADCLSNPIVHTDESVEDFLNTAPYQLIIMPKESSGSLADRIRYIIGSDFSRTFPSFEHMTEILHMSTTTLRRKLIQEGTTFQQIKDKAREDASISYLSREDLSISCIAELMGFIDSSAFSRAFKRWTGYPPGVYRQEVLGMGENPDDGMINTNQHGMKLKVNLQLSSIA